METPQSTASTPATLLCGPSDGLTDASEWFQTQKQEAWEKFESLPMPTRTDEPWRFSDLKKISLEGIAPSRPVDAATAERLVARSGSSLAVGGKMVFANGFPLVTEPVSDALLAKGVIFTSLDKAFSEHEELVRRHFMVEDAQLGSEKFAALHKANLRSGTFLFVPAGVEVDVPLEVFHWLSGDGAASFPHTLLIAEAGSKVTLVDHFESADVNHAGFACAVNDLYAGEGAEVTYVCTQDWSENTLAFQMNATVTEKDATITGLNLNLGASYSRVESRSRMAGEGGQSHMLAATVADQNQIFDLRTAQDHAECHTGSNLLYKNALSDKAKAIFSGIIRVEEGAHQTDAYQTNRTLVLSEEAESISMPGLEILADDVKCSHGSTTSNISEEELFYLLARGIPARVAKQLMVVGFLSEVIERLSDEGLAERLHDQIEGKFQRMLARM